MVDDGGMITRLRRRQEWAFFGALHRAAPGHAAAWWLGLVVRGSLPAVIAVTSGWLIAAVTDGDALTAPLVALAVVFVAAQVVGPLHEAVAQSEAYGVWRSAPRNLLVERLLEEMPRALPPGH